MYQTSSFMVLRDERHDVKHYVGVGLKTVLAYGVFVVFLFSVPFAQFVADTVFAKGADRAVIGETSITIERAISEAERIKGLSGRESMPPNHGLLFVFPNAGYHGMYMKDMRFALDIVWLDQYDEVIYIERNVTPDTFPETFQPNKPATSVIEFNAGFVRKNNIKIGDRFVLL